MNLNDWKAILAEAGPPPATQQDPRAQSLQLTILMGVGLFLFWFLMVRPQSKKAREHAIMLKTVKPNDRVVTSSGIVGIVVSVKEKTVAIRSSDTKLEVLKSAISEITERAAAGPNEAKQSES